MNDLFEPTVIPADAKDASGKMMRTCGMCFKPKCLELEFYRDGKDKDGSHKYRRDCKECYRIARLKSRRVKAMPAAPPPKKRGRNK